MTTLTLNDRVEMCLFPLMFTGIIQVGARVSDGSLRDDHPGFLEAMALLKRAILEPVLDLNPQGQRYVLHGPCKNHFKAVEVRFFVIRKDGKEQTNPIKIAAICFYGLNCLLQTEVIELHEGTSMAQAMAIMQPWFAPIFEDPKLARMDESAQRQAVKMLDFLASERKLYEAWLERKHLLIELQSQ